MADKARLEEFIVTLADYHLPRYSELPDLPLYMDQVVVLMERYLAGLTAEVDRLITPAMINNYVKQGVIPPPVNKKYEKKHLAYLVVVCILKQVMAISEIKSAIEKELEDGEIHGLYDDFCHEQEEAFHAAAEVMNEARGQQSDEKLAMQMAVSAGAQKISAALLLYGSLTPESKEKEKKKDKK